jgi:2-polyprenyl-6-methoxyphenol hydroxylase-like FAD-dependent oxidoreductase
MKIIIVGAGISGLATYLNLKKFLPEPPSGGPHTVTIYESHQTAKDDAGNLIPEIGIGGGLGVAPNGLSELGKLDPEIKNAVVAQGFPTNSFQIKNAWGWTLGCVGASSSSSGAPQSTVMSRRQGIWACLKAKVPDDVLIGRRKVTEVKRGEDGKLTIVFADGQTDSADIVIGADGVKSVVKKFVVGDAYPPQYE